MRFLFILLSCIVLISAPAIASQEETAPAVAVVLTADGSLGFATAPDGSARPANAMQVLVAGTRLEVKKTGWLVLGFKDGRRLRLAGEVSGIVTEHGVKLENGAVEELENLPALTQLVPIIAAPDACTTRIRSQSENSGGLDQHPVSGSRVAPGTLTLEFNPPPAYQRFEVVVSKAWDCQVHRVKTDAGRVELPADLVEPGETYHWSIESLDTGRPGIYDVAVFTTLTPDVAVARDQLRLAAEGDNSLALLLASVDTALCIADAESFSSSTADSR